MDKPPPARAKALPPFRRLAPWTLLALASALTAATVASFLGGLWWMFDAASEFRLQLAAGALFLMVGAVALRRRRLVAIGALCFALHAATIAGPLLVPGAEAAPAGAVAFRLTTLNLLYTNRDSRATLDYVAHARPDIAVFEEATRHWPASLAPLRASLPHVVRIPRDIGFGKNMMLFSRYPVLDVVYERPVPTYLPILVARVAVGTEVVTVIAVHPTHPTSAAKADTRALYLGRVADIAARTAGPVVVAGDFNATPWARPFRRLESEARLIDAAARRPWLMTWPSWLPGFGIPIDHVLINRHLAVKRLERGPDVGSDHYPLTVDLVVTRP